MFFLQYFFKLRESCEK